MRYFHYISKSKVEMLDGQIKKGAHTSKFELLGNLGLLKGKIVQERSLVGDLVERLERVEKKVRKEEKIGDISNPSKWIADKGLAFATSMKDTGGAVFYFLRTGTTYIALGGSRGNLISEGPSRTNKFGFSFAPDLVSVLEGLERRPQILDLDDEGLGRILESGIAADKPWANMIYCQCDHRRNSTFDTPISFFARKLHEDYYMGKRIILATPLYIESLG